MKILLIIKKKSINDKILILQIQILYVVALLSMAYTS